MKNSVFVVVYFSLGAFVNLFSPHLVNAKYYVDNALCMTCHAHSDFVSYHNGYECSVCHNNGSTVTSENCSKCHFSIGQDEANLVDYHEGMGADCLSCHVSAHIETCLVCHESDDIHGSEGHFPCGECHAVHGGMKKIQPDKCIECHPLVDPGKCNVADYHGDFCLECHTECVEDASTTTTVPPGHMGICLECHFPNALHFKEEHSDCVQCHQEEVVGISTCSACHPVGEPGTCGIASIHGSSCLECHFACGDTTHMDICLGCHVEDVLHAYEGHDDGNCAQCHDSESGGGQVDAGRCSTCHPDDDPGKCNLANRHGTRCYICHTDCADGPVTTTTVPPGHIGDCLACHYPDILHEKDAHAADCTQCHDGLPQAGNVKPGDCVSCHPAGEPGTCGIASIHGSSCLECHFACGDTTHMDICLGCHSSEDILAQHEVELDVGTCSTCHPQGNPGKCNLASRHATKCIGCHTECTDGPTTTTSVPPGHTGICLGCHSPNNLHFKEDEEGEEVHNKCDQCHQGGDVRASACSACHPVGDPGTCSLASYHGSTCLNCHVMCADSTTTTTPGEPTPTTVPPFAHREICLACHDTDDLHEGKGHSSLSCSLCHEDGRGQAGNVEPESCVACHPAGAPGKCNLASMHGPSTCLRCHQADCKEEVTTTTVEPTTTTTATDATHIEICMECHNSNDLHDRVEHNDCTHCHEGTPQAGNVEPGTCIVCHPVGDSGFCSLVTHHGGSCLECHSECKDDFPPIVTIDITLFPKSVFRSHFMPLPLVMVITGTDSNFNSGTRVDFEGNDALFPPFSILLSPERIIVLSIIRAAGFKATEDTEVAVNVSSTVDLGGGESYEEVGGWSLTLKLLPLILDEK